MRSSFGCFTAGFILLLCFNARAQNSSSGLQGQVFLPGNKVADTGTVMLIRLLDSGVVGNVPISKSGTFRFNNLKPDTYKVNVNLSGYQKYATASFRVNGTGDVILPAIHLSPDVTHLKEVTVTNKQAYIETHNDRTVLNVEKGIMADGVSVLDVLGSAPGVRVNSSGDILLRGGQRASISINGRMLNLAGQDAADQLKNMPSGSISQIELITDPSAKYDAAGPGGVVNIILKKGKNEGFNGVVTAGGGYGDLYKLTPAISFNYREKALNLFGSYNFNENNTDHTIITDRLIGTTTQFDMHYFNRQKTYGSNYTIGGDYAIDASHTLGFLVIGTFNTNFLDKNTLTEIHNNQRLDSTLTTLSVLNRRINSINYNLNYNGKIGKTDQTIAADADYYIYNRNAYEDLNSVLYNVNSGLFAAQQFFRNDAPTHISNFSGKIDYVNPITKTVKLEAGIKSVFATSKNIQNFDRVVGTTHIPDPNISSQFNYDENITSAYINYIAKPSAKFNYQLDMRVEHTESDATTVNDKFSQKRSYTDYFPTLMFNYNLNADHRFALNFNRRIDRPNYIDLNPLIAYQDKYTFTMGNAYLRPMYQDNIRLSHFYKNQFVIAAYASFAKDFYNFTYFTQNNATGLFVNGKANLKRANTFGAELSAPIDITKWWNVYADADASFQHYVSYGDIIDQHTVDATFKLDQRFMLPKDLTIGVDAQYEVPVFYAIYHYKASYYVNTSASKKFFNNKGTLSFTVVDIFNTNRDRYNTEYGNINVIGFDKKETRIYRLSFSYRFGKSTVKASRKHPTGNSDELKRVTGGN